MSFDHRYVWSTGFVRDLLRTNRLSETASFCYFFAIMAFDWLQFTLIATTPTPKITAWSTAGSWITFAVTLVGLFYLFMKNGGKTGQQFLRRYFPLSVTVGWKFVAAMIITLWLTSNLLRSQSQETLGWCSTAAMAFVNIIMFWRIGFHLQLLARESTGGSSYMDGVN